MPIKVGGIFTSVFSPGAIARKQNADAQQERRQNSQPDPDPNNEQEEQSSNDHAPVDRAELERLAGELQGTPEIQAAHIGVQVVGVESDLKVRLVQATGTVIKEMAAREFVRFRKNDMKLDITRGKILDQTF